MNRWTHPVQWIQAKLDEHNSHINELRATIKELREEINRLDAQKANRAGRKSATVGDQRVKIQ